MHSGPPVTNVIKVFTLYISVILGKLTMYLLTKHNLERKKKQQKNKKLEYKLDLF